MAMSLKQTSANLAQALREHVTFVAAEPLRAVAREVPHNLLLELPVDHADAAMVLHVQDADESFASRARSGLAAQILRAEYFRELRTEQQLGYVVSVSNRPVAKRAGLSFIVQSPAVGAAEIEQATLDFLDDFVSRWPTTTDAAFEQYQSGLVNRLLEAPKNLAEQTQRYWHDLTDAHLTFDSREQIAALVQDLTREDMQAYFERINRLAQSQRLLIYTKGAFESVPEEGKTLASPTDAF